MTADKDTVVVDLVIEEREGCFVVVMKSDGVVDCESPPFESRLEAEEEVSRVEESIRLLADVIFHQPTELQ